MIASKSESGRIDSDPVAIVGIACRFPGGCEDPESFWRLLSEGEDAVREVPEDRWNAKAFYDPEPGVPGKTNAVRGGFIEGIDRFDAGFFGISPREAALMDPQQRLLLEVAADSLDDAGISMARVAGTDTGVFIGISSYDYAVIQQGQGDRMLIDAHSNTGGALSIAANRISYFFNLRGVSLALDTACSSSLVAVHLACESLWRKEIPLALAGGVNVLIKPEPWIGFSRLSMLSPDGRCKSFDASANGFVRAEGAGMLVLKPLSDAMRDGDRVYAVVLATGSNQDGRTSSMTVPGQEAQEALLRATCRRAGVAPHQLHYVEAHGTGTLVGDPIEARALGRVYGTGRPEGSECLLGSVKTNIGHLEPAAGIAGIIKVALSMKHGLLPPTLHFQRPNPEIPFDELRLHVQRELGPWPGGGPLLAGVNSFGFGGTNAHVILQSAPEPAPPKPRDPAQDRSDRSMLFPLSARSPEALRAMARSYEDFIASSDGVPLEDLASSTAERRTHHEYRLSVVADSAETLSAGLHAFANGETHARVVSGRHLGKKSPKLAFVCSGQGPQWWAMGRELLADEPVFREKIERCDELVRRLGSWSLLNELRRDEATSRLHETAIAQPAIFALQVALAALWESWGIRPDALVGHSVGEVAAAHLAGALGLDDAVRVIFHRGRCMELASPHGRMLAVGLPAADAIDLIEGRDEDVSLAAINGPSAVTLSGGAKALQAIAQELAGRDVFHRFLKVDYAFHSALMEPIREQLLESLEGITPAAASLPMVSTVTGRAVDGPELGGEYWWQNVRLPVRFATAIDALLDQGCEGFVELSPHPVLAGNVVECARERGKSAVTVLHSLRRGEPERTTMLRALGSLHTIGAPIDWSALNPDGRFVELPGYPWQRERYWSESEDSMRSRLAEHSHPLLGHRIVSAIPTWRSSLDVRAVRYLNDHRVQGQLVFPGTGYLEMVAFAVSDVFGDGPAIVEELELTRALILPDEGAKVLQTELDPEESSFRVYARGADAEKPWTKHATAKVRWTPEVSRPEPVSLESLRQRSARLLSKEDCYAQLTTMGLDYGPAFRGLEQLWAGDGEVLGRIVAPSELDREWSDHRLHPAVMDVSIQLIVGLLQGEATTAPGVYLPVAFERVRVYGRLDKALWATARLVERESRAVLADLSLFDDAGRPIVEVSGLRCQAIDDARGESLEDLVYEYQWRLAPNEGAAEAPTATTIPIPTEIAAITRSEAARLEDELGLRRIASSLERELDSLCSSFVWNALQALGADLSPGGRFTQEELVARCRIAPRFRRVLGSYLRMLASDGFLEEVDGNWEVARAPAGTSPESRLKELWFRYPTSYAELTLLRRTGARLAEVLRGDVEPLELIFPDGSLTTADHLYQHSPTMRPFNILAASVMAHVTDALPAGRRLRVVEIGAGTGGLTSYVLPRLPRDRTEYLFTDLSNHFFLRAQDRFRDYPFVEYKLLDVEKDPAEQGFEPGSFDVVLAANVLHATKNLSETVQNVKKLLAPGGLLVLLELARPLRAMDLVFGLTEGFFRFEDTDLRGTHAFLPFSGWKMLLESEGFEDVTLGSSDSPMEAQNAILARRAVSDAGDLSAESPDAEPDATADAAGSWLLLSDGGWPSERLAGELRALGGDVTLVLPGEEYRSLEEDRWEIAAARPEDFRRLVAEARPSDAPWRAVVHMWNREAVDLEECTEAALDRVMSLGNLSVAYLARALSEVEGAPPRLWVVTTGAETVDGDTLPANVTAAPVWGLNRVVMNELPKLRSVSVDLSPAPTEEEILGLTRELLQDGNEDEIALRGSGRYAHRWTRAADPSAYERALKLAGASESFRLETLRPGVMDQLALRACERAEPGEGQVEIAVAAAGLNFSDVMKALGLYPGLPAGPVPLGIECAGRVERIGNGVRNVAVGDEVVAIAPFSFGRRVVAEAALVVPKPDTSSFEEAATLPIAALTAHYALNYMGRLSRGERVLVHSATGGVGLAALQMAWDVGAEVFATAGTKEKRDFLRSLGVRHVMDSRSLDFADEILEATEGEGIDVVLNSLSGEAIYKGLSVLRDYGRFLEIGKRDIYQNHRLGMRPFRKNLSFMAIDLDRGIRERPELFSGLFREAMSFFQERKLHPLPHRAFPISDAVSAFRHMAQAKHVGKVVLSLSERRVSVVPAESKEITFRENGTYLISGGLGGFGLATARWLAERGGRHIVLMGRSGAATEEARAAVEQLRRAGADVKVVAADVSVEEQVAATLAEIDETMPPLRGVFHLALALDDALLMKLNEDQMRTVWAPKVKGAFHLHRLTAGKTLDLFALYSSMSAVFGTEGQANYASANSFMDALAFYRRAKGLPGLSVSWGFLGGTGFVSRHPDVAKRFEATGIRSFSPGQGLKLLGRFLSEERTHAGVMRVDWRYFQEITPARGASPRFAHLVQMGAEDDRDASRRGSAFRLALLAASPAERRAMLEAGLGEQIGRVLGVATDKLDVDTPLSDLGLDSLMAIELRNWVEGDLRVSLPAVELLKGPSIAQLVDLLAAQLSETEEPATPKPEAEVVRPDGDEDRSRRAAAELLQKVDEMSDDEVDSLLKEMEGREGEPQGGDVLGSVGR